MNNVQQHTKKSKISLHHIAGSNGNRNGYNSGNITFFNSKMWPKIRLGEDILKTSLKTVIVH